MNVPAVTAAPSTSPHFDMAPMRVGTMIPCKGTSTQVPFLPDLKMTSGDAWVTECSPTALTISEHAVARHVLPMDMKMQLHMTTPGHVEYTVTGQVAGIPMPVFRRDYEMTGAGAGWFELRPSLTSTEEPSTMRVSGSQLSTNFRGPAGTSNHNSEQIVQPGEPGYISPPASDLPPR